MQPNPRIKTIGLSLTSLASGGAEKQCLLLASLLQPIYKVVIIIVDSMPRHQQHLSFIKEHALDVKYLSGSYLKKSLQLRRIVHELNIDLIFSYLPKDIILTSLAVGTQVPYHIGGIRNARLSVVKRHCLRIVHNLRLYGSISNCFSGKQFFAAKGFDNSKITVIPNGIKLMTKPIKRSTGRLVTITSLGRLVKQKDYPTALKTIAHLKNKLPDLEHKIHYNIVGDGPEKHTVNNLIAQSELSDCISVTTDAKDIPSILERTDIYLCTSLFEGVSNAIMEAMAHSLPIVATDAGDNKILVRDQLNGYLLGLEDDVGIGNALMKLIQSPDLRQQMGKASFDLIEKEFNLDKFLMRYDQFIKELS